MIQTTLFISGNDPHLDRIITDLKKIKDEHPHQLHVINIEKSEILKENFKDKAPVLDVGVFRLVGDFDLDEIIYAFTRAEQRLVEAEAKGNDALSRQITEPMKMTRADRFSRWFSEHYMMLLNLFSFLYVFFAFLAPTFMKIGWHTPGKVIYKVYSPLCHQLAFRSYFLFGEQPYYPRDLADMSDILTYGQATGFDEFDISSARDFLGDEALGYKIALCQRDVAIYGAIFIFGIVFSSTGRRIKPLPWYLWILIGLGPIGLDGFSQLLSQTGLGIFSWLPLRESTPLLRSFTGLCFGLATAWFGFPYLEESIQENRHDMALKLAITEQLSQEG